MKGILQFGLVILNLFLLSCQTKEPSANVVLIVVDDMGWKDVSYNGSTFYETPQIDKLSQASIEFTNAYASASICSPTRAAILTGRHPVRIGITDWLPGADPQDRPFLGTNDLAQMPLSEVTIAEVLKQNNYTTFFAGKWHLGGGAYLPEHQGFDYNIGGHDKGSPPGGYYVPYKNPKLIDGPEGEYLTDRLVDESIQFVKENKDDPFFLMLSFYNVHTPIQPNKEYVSKFEQKALQLDEQSPIFEEEHNARTVINQSNAEYASMVYATDQNVGRLLDALKEEGIYENTTIIFTSDNGGLSTLEANRDYPSPTSVRPLRAGKGWLYEGGIRVPLLVKPAYYNDSKRVVDYPVVSHDIMPTLCAMHNIEFDVSSLDGINLSPLFEGQDQLKRNTLYWHYPHYHGSGWAPGAAIRQGDWKLIEFQDRQEVELYNLADDISERKDVSLDYPEKVDSLLQSLSELQQEMGAKYIEKNPAL